MFVVFYTVNLYICVFMTCSTSYCLYDTLWIHGIYVCMQRNMVARKTYMLKYHTDISTCPFVGRMPLSSARRGIVYILKRNRVWAININLNHLQTLWIRWIQGKICFIKMKINYIKNACHLFIVFNMFYECLEMMLHCYRLYIGRFCNQQRVLLCSLMWITGMWIKNKNDGITQKLTACSKLLHVSSDVFV